MKLSVVIVNYNVRAYLEQCLTTVLRAMEGLQGEVFVVDNLSTDGSVEMVRDKFPQVRLIANRVNAGFSRANNQAIQQANGEYILLLNPDTVVGEKVFHQVVQFMDTHPDAGGLGVKMIDGTGQFLPESKRGLPTPSVAFFKIIGLARLFPRSRTFGRYHLGHLPENETSPIEILSGACMLLRKSTLDKVGLLDESFFMYGEDIDLSYRILLGGYQNYYFHEARIIHYKGESTKKSSINYVLVFYNAMAIFARKHFTRKSADLFALLIDLAIFLSAATAIAMRFILRAILPIMDLLLLISAAWIYRMIAGPESTSFGVLLASAAGLWGIAALSGIYDRPVHLFKVFRGAVFGGLALGMVGALTTIPLTWPVIAWLCGIFIACATLARVFMHLTKIKGYDLQHERRHRLLIIGSEAEGQRASALLWQTHFGLGKVLHLDPTETPIEVAQLRKRIRSERIDEVIFCAEDIGPGQIIELMQDLRRSKVQFKIAQPESSFIIGPNSIEALQDLFVLKDRSVATAASRRAKRILDLAIACALSLALPIGIWAISEKRGFIKNLMDVFKGDRTWVGYHRAGGGAAKLPDMRSGILTPALALDERSRGNASALRRMNIVYAKDRTLWTDLRLIIKGFHSLGKR